tara:strand:+ start:242 stop:532 length:291 start_codon:yes stop_codon:yes gene_type:complete
MTKMDDFTMEELMIFTVSILGALGGFMVVLQKSKCKSICWGCCIRDVDAVIAEEKLEITGHSGTTPRRMSLAEINRDVKLELKKEADEPEIEPSKN